MFGRLKNWWNERQASKIPNDLTRIINGLPEGWQLVTFRRTTADNWTVELSYQRRRFQIDSDHGYPWTAIELTDNEPPILSQPLNERWSATGNPEHIHEALARIAPGKK